MTLRCRHLYILALPLALALGACDSTAPFTGNYDVDGSQEGIQAVESAFQTEAYTSFVALGPQFTLDGVSPAASVLAVDAARRHSLGISERMDQAAGEALAALAAPAAILIPDQYRGRTYVYVPGEGYQYDDTRTDAPATGVRFVIYAVDPITGDPVEPLNEIGSADLIDESTETVASVRLRVESQSVEYLNYAVTASGPPTSPTVVIEGFATDGTDRADFTLEHALEATFAGADVDVNYDISVNDFSISAAIHWATDGESNTIDIDMEFRAGGNMVELDGQVTDEAGSLTVTANGTTFATINLTPTSIEVVNGDGEPLTVAERETLEEIWQVVEDVFDAFEDLFDPVEFLFDVG